MDTNIVIDSDFIKQRKNALRNKDMTGYIFDILCSNQDAETLWTVRQINRNCYRVCRQNRRQYYSNSWTLVYKLGKSPYASGILMNSIIDLFLEELCIVPHPPDVHLLVEDDRFNRINSRETLTWPICLDEIVPDDLPGGNGMTFKINREGALRVTAQTITNWMKNYLYIDLEWWYAGVNFTDAFDRDLNIWGPIETELDTFFYRLVESRNIIAPDVWKSEYNRYDLTGNSGRGNITNLLNKIRNIHNFLDCLNRSYNHYRF